MRRSRYNRFAVEYFEDSAEGYVFEGDLQALERRLYEGGVEDFEED